MARPERFELPTAWFVARYSIQLSYGRYVFQQISGGEGGIRTLEGLLTLTPLAGERFRPLSHLSVLSLFTIGLSRQISKFLRFSWSGHPGFSWQITRVQSAAIIVPFTSSFRGLDLSATSPYFLSFRLAIFARFLNSFVSNGQGIQVFPGKLLEFRPQQSSCHLPALSADWTTQPPLRSFLFWPF